MTWGQVMLLGFGASGKAAKQLRIAGDSARDQRNWEEAAKNYSQYLETETKDFAIWVQLGHALKEQQKYEDAELAYRNARELKLDDADIHLQLGHLLKIRGRNKEALESYAKSYQLEPTYAAEMEIKALDVDAEARFSKAISSQFNSTDIVYIELDDMLIYLDSHSAVSGIQRVQTEFAKYIAERGCEINGTKFVFVVNPPYQECLWGLRSEAVLELVRYANGSDVDHTHLKQLVASTRSSATRITPIAGQCYLVLGAFWIFSTISGRFLHLKRKGVRIGAYIYDLIPITNPEYCDEGLCHEFLLCFADAMQIFDFILTISQFTKTEVINFRNKFGLSAMPVEAVQLPHANKVENDESGWTPKIRALKGKKFALMVSTIEARKNHKYLVDAWRQLYNEGLEPPDLVFVGRFGWRVDDLMKTLSQSRNFNGRLHILHGLTDGELNKLYQECSFTVFPSFVEGWGLPVGEGLAHGKPSISSMTSAMPEVGGDFVDYVDPWNLRAGIEVIRKMCFDDAYRESRRRNIEKNFVARNWGDFSKSLAAAIDKHRLATIEERIYQAKFDAGYIFKPSQLAFGNQLPANYAVTPMRILLASSWGVVEHWGSWLHGAHGDIEFKSPYKEGDDVLVYLELVGPGHVGDDQYLTVVIDDDEAPTIDESSAKWTKIPAGKVFVVKVGGKFGAHGVVKLNFFIKGEIKPENDQPKARKFALGMSSLAYSRTDDIVSRAEITETLVSGIAKI